MTDAAPSSAPRWHALAVLAAGLVIYGLTSFGALRSPDSEVVFEVGQALVDRGTFAVEGVSSWEGFGLAPGRDGRLYSVFGPGQSLACAGLLWAGRALGVAGAGAPAGINPSFYVDRGQRRFMDRLPPGDRALHGDRFVASWVNVLAGALGAVAFHALARRLSAHAGAALGATALYGLGTLAWPYAGWCFSEPLATLFVLLSLLGLLGRTAPALAGAGLALGAAAATHVTALLFAPFFAAHALVAGGRAAGRRRGLWFLAGLIPALALLALYNHARFGDVLETGRGVDPELAARFGYGHFVAPWVGLAGFAHGAGKSLFVFVPALLLAALAWPSFLRARPALGWTIAAAALARVLFVASRSDWHGGFCLGPRLLFMLVPLLLLPVVPWLERLLVRGERAAVWAFAAATWACIAEQLLFVIGEPFTFYRRIVEVYVPRNVDVFAADRLYVDWAFLPMTRLLTGPRGPWLLRSIPLSNRALWLALVLVAAGACAAAAWWATRRATGRSPGRAASPGPARRAASR